jgi:hypothetical protein
MTISEIIYSYCHNANNSPAVVGIVTNNSTPSIAIFVSAKKNGAESCFYTTTENNNKECSIFQKEGVQFFALKICK